MEQNVIGPREARVPLMVRVATDPALADCWSVNVSLAGIGLSCGAAVDLRVGEGDSLRLAFSLPGSDREIRAEATVMWLAERAGPRTAMGLRFANMPAADRAVLGRYLRERRYQVALVSAPEAIATELGRRLDGQARVHRADDAQAALELLGRGDLSALVVFGDAPALLDRLATAAVGLATELMPLVVICADLPTAELVRFFNDGRLFRVLPPPVEPAALDRAIQEACRQHGERSEERRAVLALQRALARRVVPAAAALPASPALVGESPAMRAVLDLARRVAAYKTSVLLHGETGVGKEVLAGLIHEMSSRAGAPLVVQDCGVLTSTLLESELFGHVRGAFTGAVADNPGLFVAADGGTIFLDEIENTTPELQAKLLRVIEAGTLRPVGGTKMRTVDVRVIAASNRDLRREVEAGRFRADLFYRLNTFPIRIPPLRERREDVLPLAEHFLAAMRLRLEWRTPGFTEAARRWLLEHSWPGNIRELRNVVERAVLLCNDDRAIDADLMPELVRDAAPDAGSQSLRARVRAAERVLIAAALAQSGGVLRRAARTLATSPVTLRRKAIAYGLLEG